MIFFQAKRQIVKDQSFFKYETNSNIFFHETQLAP